MLNKICLPKAVEKRSVKYWLTSVEEGELNRISLETGTNANLDKPIETEKYTCRSK